MSETLSIDFSKPLPVFPLPGCVLLPQTMIPLHIFEPRYKRMVGDALRGRRLIAMALFEGDEWKLNYRGNPAVRGHVGVGYIVRHEELEEGGYNILLQGVCRARVCRESPHRQYRLAVLEPTERGQRMEIDLEGYRKSIEGLLHDPLLQQLASVSAIHNWLSKEIPTDVLIDLAFSAVCDRVEERYRMLAEADPQRRGRMLEEELKKMRRTLRIAEQYEGADSEEQAGMN